MNIKPGDRVKLLFTVARVFGDDSFSVEGMANGPCFRREGVIEVIPAPQPFGIGDRVRCREAKAILEIISLSYIRNEEWAWCWWPDGASPISIKTVDLTRA